MLDGLRIKSGLLFIGKVVTLIHVSLTVVTEGARLFRLAMENAEALD